MAAPLYAWPWEFLGDYKCALYGIFLAKGLYSRYQEQTFKDSNWCLHIFIICMLRLFLYQAWTSYGNMLFLTRNRRIIKEGVDFKQIDKEWHWYHRLHHAEMGSNYCLFMPLFDALGNTLNKKSWQMHKKNSFDSGKNSRVPDFVFLAHVVDLSSAAHTPFAIRSVASLPYCTRIYLIPLLPVTFVAMLMMWAKSKYFLPFAAEGINKQIEEAILRANRLGVKVISLAALNKNEALNGGGTLFVDKHPNLKVRVVHGNTLTAAVILNEIPKDIREVFLTGATSKLGRAIALYLCRNKVRVLVNATLSNERFRKIQEEAPTDCQQYLVQVTKYQAAQNCKTWIVGKWITRREQKFAPSGTHFHQFVVPPIFQFRRDCTYGDLAAMKLPQDVQGLGCCEYTMDRGVVHACHAGGVVHALEGWTHHEVGAIDVHRIDLVWKAALKHGLKPVSNITSNF
ncbi:hypothetical protein DH2020_014151 [Rehmannia glutinosa]|uniref:Very-long-chain aldehyde decarbonylase CER1-like C-terminal domain-containing protein n=1 Tax=Rehmannia glutinosa TaxID=99300 RepID=A0ABR0WY56_REHGL